MFLINLNNQFSSLTLKANLLINYLIKGMVQTCIGVLDRFL
jgi:hypothetical protein